MIVVVDYDPAWPATFEHVGPLRAAGVAADQVDAIERANRKP